MKHFLLFRHAKLPVSESLSSPIACVSALHRLRQLPQIGLGDEVNREQSHGR